MSPMSLPGGDVVLGESSGQFLLEHGVSFLERGTLCLLRDYNVEALVSVFLESILIVLAGLQKVGNDYADVLSINCLV